MYKDTPPARRSASLLMLAGWICWITSFLTPAMRGDSFGAMNPARLIRLVRGYIEDGQLDLGILLAGLLLLACVASNVTLFVRTRRWISVITLLLPWLFMLALVIYNWLMLVILLASLWTQLPWVVGMTLVHLARLRCATLPLRPWQLFGASGHATDADGAIGDQPADASAPSPRRLAAVVLLAMAVIAFGAQGASRQQWFLGMIPAGIGAGGWSRIGERSGIFAGCGAAVFKLSASSRRQIERQGVNFFASARQARGHSDYYHSYDAWRETPIRDPLPGNNNPEILWRGLHCADLDRKTRQELGEATRKPGSFFTTGQEKVLLVSPSLGLVVFAYSG